MKIKLILKTIGSFLLILILFTISSCSKSANESLTKEQIDEESETASFGELDFTESDEDLSTVDYKEFYDQLSPHGEWIQVRSEEIGLKPNTAMIQSENSNDIIFSLRNIFGLEEAIASSDVSESMVFVWKPSVDLGVTIKSGDAPVFKPYTNGQWVNTDAGWYFKAPTPVEETVSHYGRWVNSPSAGWLWVPGRVWAPAWVDWRQNEEYVSWAPLPPSVYLVNNVMTVPEINDNDYLIVERKYFLEPAVYKYQTLYYKDGNTILINELARTDGIVVSNNILTNLGPDVITIQNIYGRNIEFIKLHHVKKHKEVVYSNGEYFVYSPGFRKFKNKGNKRIIVNAPKSYKEYDDWKVKDSDEKESENEGMNAGKDNNSNKNNGNNDDKNKGNYDNKNNGNNDDKNKGNNDDKNKGSYDNKNNGKNNDVNKGKDNDNKNKGKDNGSKSNDKNNGNKNNGKNDGKGKK